MIQEIKVLTLWQPWATLLSHGLKLNETRPGKTSFRGLYLIHAAQKWTRMQYHICNQEPFKSQLNKLHIFQTTGRGVGGSLKSDYEFPLGHIIGAFQVDRCITITEDKLKWDNTYYYLDDIKFDFNEYSFGDYGIGRSVWIGKNHRLLETPMPYKNGQGYYQNYKGNRELLKFIKYVE